MIEASLSPRYLFELLQPTFGLDDVVVGDYVLADCYRLDEAEPVCVELRGGGAGGSKRSLVIEVEPLSDHGEDGQRDPPASVAGLGLCYRAPAPGELGLAACRALAGALELSLGEPRRRWKVLPPSLSNLPTPIAAEVRREPAQLDADPDSDLFLRDFDNYEELFAMRPEVYSVYAGDEPAPGVSVYYPMPRVGRVPNSGSVYVTDTRTTHRRRMRRYFASLGCVFDEEGCARTVPTPTTYARAVTWRGRGPRIHPVMLAGILPSVRPAAWGVIVRRHLLVVTVAPRWAVEIHRRARTIKLLENIPCDVGMAPHDMGLHALALHAVPAVAWDELVSLAFERIRAHRWGMLVGPWGVLQRVAFFFEGPVTTGCWEAWRDADEPEDFESIFGSRFEALKQELRQI